MRHAHSTCVTAAVALVLVAAPPATSQVQYSTVSLSGQPAPGLPAGVNYLSLNTPTVNDVGQSAYTAVLTGTGVTAANNGALFAGALASPQLVARRGDAAPGMSAGVTYAGLTPPSLSDPGDVAFIATLAGTGITTANDTAVYAGALASPQPVAREGDAAPGTGAGVNYTSFETLALGDGTGTGSHLLYTAMLTGAGVTTANDRAIYAGTLAAPQLAAREGNAAPGTGAGVNYLSFGPTPIINDAGHVAYSATLTGTGVIASNNEAIYAGTPGAPFLVARTGNLAPDTPAGQNYFSLFLPAINDGGHIAFGAALSGIGVGTANDNVIYAGALASPQIVAREGSPAPGAGAGVNYSGLFTPVLNDVGQIAFRAGFTGSVAASNNEALYAGNFGSPQLIVREGDVVPGVPAGVNYSLFGALDLADSGHVAYLAALTGAGVTAANDSALFLFDPILGPMLIAREGMSFDIGGGDMRTIADNGIGFNFGRTDDTLTGLSNDGTPAFLLSATGVGSGVTTDLPLTEATGGVTLGFRLAFTDGSSGFFTAVVPEPGAAALLAVAAGHTLLRRRR